MATKQKIVIKVSMPSAKSRATVMTVVAKVAGVSSVGITGDGKDQLEVVGEGIDTVFLVKCLRKKLRHADILQVEEVKDKKKKQDEPPHCCPGYPYCYHHRPPPMVVCEDPSYNCSVM